MIFSLYAKIIRERNDYPCFGLFKQFPLFKSFDFQDMRHVQVRSLLLELPREQTSLPTEQTEPEFYGYKPLLLNCTRKLNKQQANCLSAS